MPQTEQWQLSGSGAERYEEYAVGRHLRPIAEEFLTRIQIRETDRILDVACGTGVVARLAAPLVRAPGHVVGLDLNEGMLAVARRLGAKAGLAIEWRQGDATALPFGDAAFDRVVCQQGLQFIPDKLQALREMRRVLARSGALALNVFGTPSRFHAALARGLAKFADASSAGLSLAPFAFTDPDELEALVVAGGFAAVQRSTKNISRRVEPTQQWLLQYSSALPYAAAVASMGAAARAEMLRDIASELKDLWVTDDEAGDSFVVPCEVHFVFAGA